MTYRQMKTSLWVPTICLLAAGVMATLLASHTSLRSAVGEEEGPKVKSVAAIKSIMIANNAYEEEGTAGLFKMVATFIDGKPGKDKKNEWNLARHRTAMIAEGGNLLMAHSPIKGEAKEWKAHCATFRDEVVALKKAVERRQLEKAAAALAVVKKRCTTCHDAHRPQ